MRIPALSLLQSRAVVVSLTGGCALVVLHFLYVDAIIGLAYLRGAIAEGQWWRLLTGHFVHFTGYHAAMNAVGLLFVSAVLLYRQSLLLMAGLNVFLPLFISFGLWWFHSDIDQYRGYSGVIYGLIAAGLILEWKANRGIHSLALVLLAAKIAYEQLPGYDVDYLMAEIGVPVAIEAHLWGFIGGIAFGLVALVARRSRRVSSH